MHRLFTIDHLVDEIFSYVPQSQLHILARVSSTWFQHAIPHLYKSLIIEQAVRPLGDFEYGWLTHTPKFVDSISDEVLERFLTKYAPYVRALSLASIYATVALEPIRKTASKGIPFLFPNTRSLAWRYPYDSPRCIENLTGLLSPKIDRLTFDIKDNNVLSVICPLLMTHLSALRFLCIRQIPDVKVGSHFPAVEPVQELFTMFTHTLTSVHITLYLNQPPVIECLSKMPNLCNLTIGEYATEELKRSGTCYDKEHFPSLRSFSFDGLPRSFYDIFVTPYDLGSLTVLSLNSIFTPDEVGIFISFTVEACPRIQGLSLGLRSDSNFSANSPPVVPWLLIQPISRCTELSSLSFNSMHISISLEELAGFIRSRATWKCLHILTEKPLRPQDILLYTKHCPLLEHLGIRLENFDRAGFRVKDLPDDIPTFSTLNTIDLRDSHNTDSSQLAEFLHRICNGRLFELCGEANSYLAKSTLDSLADVYIEEERRTGKEMPSDIKEFVEIRTKTPSIDDADYDAYYDVNVDDLVEDSEELEHYEEEEGDPYAWCDDINVDDLLVEDPWDEEEHKDAINDALENGPTWQDIEEEFANDRWW